MKISGNEWNCGCNASSLRWGLEDETFNSRFLEITDDPQINCTTPDQVAGNVLNEMDISWYPNNGKYFKRFIIFLYLDIFVFFVDMFLVRFGENFEIFVKNYFRGLIIRL